MPRLIDLTGKAFGRWAVLGRVVTNGRNPQWLCQCSCPEGTERLVFGSWLRSGRSKSCGCYDLDRKRVVKPGYKKGEIRVLEVAERINGKYAVQCICSCGKIYNVKAEEIREAAHPTCGSLAHSSLPRFVYKRYPKTFDRALDAKAAEIFKRHASLIYKIPESSIGDVEDIAILKLTRVAYCLAWREEQGFPVANESGYVRKMVRSAISIFYKSLKTGTTDYSGATISQSTKIGCVMNSNISNVPVAEAQTQGEVVMRKKRRFDRC